MVEKKTDTDQTVDALCAEDEAKVLLGRLTEETVGAFRHLVEKHMVSKGFPVGFSIVFYNPETYEKRWYYDARVVMDGHDPSFQTRKVRDRVTLILQFLSEGIKRILNGHHVDMIIDPTKIKGQSFQVPGLKGRG